MFPSNIDIFYDLFTGGCNVSINVSAKKIVANDYNKKIIELFKYFQETDINKIVKKIDALIKKYKLSDISKNGYEYYDCNSSNGVATYNKEAFLQMRTDYNTKQTPVSFFTLIIYAFNHQIRFNNKGEYNLPTGKRDFNKNIRNNLVLFIEHLQKIDLDFHDKDYKEIEIDKDAFVYIDPPYLASTASYNENNGWNEEKELELLAYLDSLNAKGNKFALSNVFQNKDKTNEILIAWSKKYKVHYLNHSYANSNYQAKNKSVKTIEVLITNY